FGAVGVSVEARLSDEKLRPAPELLRQVPYPVPQRLQSRLVAGSRACTRDALRRAVFTEHIAKRASPLACRNPRTRRGDGCGHDVLPALCRVTQRDESAFYVALGAARPPRVQAIDLILF